MLLACALCAPLGVARADGLYEPFPDAASDARAERFVDRLAARMPDIARLRLSGAELERGVFVERGHAVLEPGGAGRRALGSADLGPSSAWPATAVTALLLMLLAGATLRRREARPA